MPLIHKIFCMIVTFCCAGFYETDEGEPEEVYCGLKRVRKSNSNVIKKSIHACQTI